MRIPLCLHRARVSTCAGPHTCCIYATKSSCVLKRVITQFDRFALPLCRQVDFILCLAPVSHICAMLVWHVTSCSANRPKSRRMSGFWVAVYAKVWQCQPPALREQHSSMLSSRTRWPLHTATFQCSRESEPLTLGRFMNGCSCMKKGSSCFTFGSAQSHMQWPVLAACVDYLSEPSILPTRMLQYDYIFCYVQDYCCIVKGA